MQPDVIDIIAALPPLQGKRDVIVSGKQSVADIMKEVLTSHSVFTNDYDLIADYFANSVDPLRELFKFCKSVMPYVAEDEKDQTSRSPIAILMTADSWGVDCKHYAGFIAGVIDAMNRAGYSNYDWCYRFASYDILDPTKEHVFVVVNPGGHQIWLDPAPVENSDGSYTERSFNDRKVIPFYITDKNPSTMGLNRITGCCNINPHYQAMGYISPFKEILDNAFTANNMDTLDNYDPVIMDSGSQFQLPTIVEYLDGWPSASTQPATLPEQPTDPTTPTYSAADLNKIENVNNPVLPTPVLSLSNTDSSSSPTSTNTPTNTGLSTNLSIMEMIKANPVESILIGTGAVVGLVLIVRHMKKKKRKR